jgi:hypothetical protein
VRIDEEAYGSVAEFKKMYDSAIEKILNN